MKIHNVIVYDFQITGSELYRKSFGYLEIRNFVVTVQILKCYKFFDTFLFFTMLMLFIILLDCKYSVRKIHTTMQPSKIRKKSLYFVAESYS